MKKSLYIIILTIFIFSLYSCKKESSKEPEKTPEKSIKKVSYKVCLDEKFCDGIRLGNYSYILKITPNLSKPKNNMEYRLLLIRNKKMYNSGNLKLNDSIINILINKNTIKDLYKRNKKDSINIQNFHLLGANYNYSRASEIHFDVPMYSIKDSLFCEMSYHFNYSNGKYRFGINVIKEKKIEAFEKYKNFSCRTFQCD
ncbi:hypothetical protein I2486_08555 [Cellulophaga sp. E16_2]|uniref:Lipoprotein n=1 Tax=Cellulophaga algicola (strain DSM 14237 / IC166 / ACAM 630) TaxID=688270 RepID=E6XCL5_CELAD|nr:MULTISPECIES: hypothetical protein [Cellulophaga]ADV49004.1 hypothetical protein Celal_1702 [Cellulophaga algicola DSM 14237]MBO0591459.1 hypothetical protein [Cellulophaga sp. E16_2]